MCAPAITWELLHSLPKVLLHEHLDGGLRPATVLELARDAGWEELPRGTAGDLGEWFHTGAARGTLGRYLEGFRHTIAVMQTAEALERVAYEALEDLAGENVVYAELRFAPHFHTRAGLGLDAVMSAVLRGCERARSDHGIEFGLLVCAMRGQSNELSLKLAELAAAWFDRGVVGFDLAGEEYGHPAKHHLEAFQLIKRRNGSITIHAGESFGPESIWQALQYCGAHRIGHGTRLFEDIVVYDKKVIRVGSLARYVLDHRIPIEACLSSNVHTGATPSLEEHPFPYYLAEGYRVTLNTDNRLMSSTTLTGEFQLAVETFGCTLEDLQRLTENAIQASFIGYGVRRALLEERILPGFAKVSPRPKGWPSPI